MAAPRQQTTIRLSPAERRVLQAAARRQDLPWSTWMREAAVEASVAVLERELDDVRPSDDGEGVDDG